MLQLLFKKGERVMKNTVLTTKTRFIAEKVNVFIAGHASFFAV